MTLSFRFNTKVIAWGSYDFADQAFQSLFITFLFPVLVVEHLQGTEFQVGLVTSCSVLAAALLVPWLGAISDLTGRRLNILLWTAIMTGLLGVMTGYSELRTALFMAFLARITHDVSKSIYDAKMIEVTTPRHFGALSGIGMAFGYSGAIISLAVAYLLMNRFGWQRLESIQAVFWMSAAWYLVFLIPILLYLPDPDKKSFTSLKVLFATALKQVIETLRGLPKTEKLGPFLGASFLYNNGMTTVVIFLALYSIREIGLTVQQFFPIYALMAASSGLGAIVCGRLADRFRPPRIIRSCLIIWMILIIILIIRLNHPLFFAVSLVGGLVFGGIWTLNRHMIADIADTASIARTFGFEGLTSRLSGLFKLAASQRVSHLSRSRCVL